MRDTLLLINLCKSTSRAVAKKLRGEGYFCLIVSPDEPLEAFIAPETRGLVICGGSKGNPQEMPDPEKLASFGLPVLAFGDAALGICQSMGGSLVSFGEGPQPIRVSSDSQEPLLAGIQEAERYLEAPTCMNLPGGFHPVAWTSDGGVVGFAWNTHPVYGFAFQVEANDPEGVRSLQNFAGEICNCEAWWSDTAFIDFAVDEIRRESDGGEAICAVSGGVDSAVCAALGTLALGDKMRCIFVDTGLLRLGEADDIMQNLQHIAGLKIDRIDTASEFMEALQGVRDSREKEQIIYARLRAHIRHEVSDMPDVRLILQGTNYSDTFGTSLSMRSELTGARVRLLEPVRFLFKDEIRRVAQALRLPESVCKRQPFPSSGLALRIVPEVTPERLKYLQEADQIVREEIEAPGLNKRLWQYYASLYDNPIDTEGIVITIRAVQALERGAVAARLPSDVVERMTERIIKTIPGVIRVLYDMTPSQSYGRMEWR